MFLERMAGKGPGGPRTGPRLARAPPAPWPLRSVDAELVPAAVDPLDDVIAHANRAPPLPRDFAGALRGRVDAELRPEAGDRRREVEVVDRGRLDEHAVAGGIDPRRHGPHDVLPVARVDVVIDDDDELRVHELAQIRPDAEHDAARVPGILLADADDGDPIRAGI